MKTQNALALITTIKRWFQNEDNKILGTKTVEDVAYKLQKDISTVFTPKHIKMAWNYEEKNTQMYSFEEAVDWTKRNMPEGINSLAILKENNADDSITLHLTYLDENQNTLVDGEFPHLVVNTFEIDNEFINMFGNKDLILLK